jgi:hypothetical protein
MKYIGKVWLKKIISKYEHKIIENKNELPGQSKDKKNCWHCDTK